MALGLAAQWPYRQALLMEADPAGGDLATRLGVSHEPGLAAMAMTTHRTAPVPELAGRHWWQRLPCGVPATLAPRAVATTESLATLNADHGAAVRHRLLAAGMATVLDAGRWHPDSPVSPMLVAADVVLLVITGDAEQVHHGTERVEQLRERVTDVRLVVVGDRGVWPPEETARAMRVPLAGTVPSDSRGAALLAGRVPPHHGWSAGRWRRLPLLRACHRLGHGLSLGQVADPPAGSPSGNGGARSLLRRSISGPPATRS